MKTPDLGSDEDHHLDIAHVHERRALLASLIDSSEDAVYSKDTHGNITSWNPAAERLYGYAAREAIGRSISFLIPPHRSGEEMHILARTLAGERIPHYETERLASNGQIVPVSLTISPIQNAAGRIIGASVIARDLTRQQEAERTSALLAAIVESSPDAIYFQNSANRIATWNQGAQRLYGYAPHDALDQPTSLLVPTRREGEADRILERVLAGEAIGPYETERLTKDGRIVEISLTVWPLRDPAGRVVGACATAQDISARKDAEAKLELARRHAIEREQLAGLGELTLGITRELEAPLTSLRVNVETTRRHLLELQDLPPEAGASIGLEECQRVQAHAQEAIRRAQRMLDSLRFVATPSREPKTYVDPKALIDNVLCTLKDRTPPHIRIHREETATSPILARPGDVSRVLVDILANALDAAAPPEAGEITIRTRQTGNALILAITDNGAGIPTEDHKRVFTPFYTTKPHGSGLSLYAARRIVADHGGSLTFASIPHEATTFSLDLPYHPASHAAPARRAGADTPTWV